jgi:uncharacterized protein (TIGR02246 family)
MEITMRIAVLLVLGTILCASPAAGQSKADVQKLDDALAAALNKTDATAVANFYAEDAILLPPGMARIQGRNAIKKFWNNTLTSLSEVKLMADEVEAMGPSAAQEIGHFTGTVKAKEPEKVSGKYVILWRKVGPDWRIGTDIWNFDK